MKQLLCQQLDDYMLGWLSADEAAAFQRHLADCPACRREQALQQSIDGLLAKAGEQSDTIPAGLVDRTKYYVQTSRRHKALRWTFSLTATAAVLLLAFLGHFMFRYGPAENQGIAIVNNTTVTPENALPPLPFRGSEPPTISTRVKLADPSSGIVLECKTRNPKINLVWIYPTVNAVAQLDK